METLCPLPKMDFIQRSLFAFNMIKKVANLLFLHFGMGFLQEKKKRYT